MILKYIHPLRRRLKSGCNPSLLGQSHLHSCDSSGSEPSTSRSPVTQLPVTSFTPQPSCSYQISSPPPNILSASVLSPASPHVNVLKTGKTYCKSQSSSPFLTSPLSPFFKSPLKRPKNQSIKTLTRSHILSSNMRSPLKTPSPFKRKTELSPYSPHFNVHEVDPYVKKLTATSEPASTTDRDEPSTLSSPLHESCENFSHVPSPPMLTSADNEAQCNATNLPIPSSAPESSVRVQLFPPSSDCDSSVHPPSVSLSCLDESSVRVQLFPPSSDCDSSVHPQSVSLSCLDDVGVQPLDGATVVNVSARKPRKKKELPENVLALRKKIKKLQQQLRREKQRKQLPRNAKNLSRQELIEATAAYLNKPTHLLFAAQLSMSGITKHARRWSKDMKSLALSIYFHSPKTYRYMRKFLILPSVPTIRRFLKLLPVSPGINPSVINALKLNIENWKEHEKVCCLILDEMSISANILYEPSKDLITGFVDDGFKRKNKFANEGLFAMVKGITKPWKQAIGYWLTANSESSDTISSAVKQCITALNEIGLKVKVIGTDQGPKNQKMATDLGVTEEKPYFSWMGENIYYMWDSPHLLKSVRNNFMDKPLLYGGNEVHWKYVRATAQTRHPLRLKLLPKISNEHLGVTNLRKMKVSLATKIFSYSMFIAMLVFICLKKIPRIAEGTAHFINDFDRLFDIFNSMQLNESKTKSNYAISLNSRSQIKFLKYMRTKLDSSRYLKGRKRPASLSGWISNINSILALLQDIIQFSITKIRTRLLSTDAIENFFATMRQQHGSNEHPTSKQVETGFRALILTSIPKLSNRSNCETDVEQFIVSVQNLPPPIEVDRDSDIEEDELDDPDYVPAPSSKDICDSLDPDDVIEANAIYYVAGYFSFKFLGSHACTVCESILSVPKNLQTFTKAHQTFMSLKAYSEQFGGEYGNLCIPTDDAYDSFLELENIFLRIFESSCHKPRIAARIKTAFAASGKGLQLCTPEMTESYISMIVKIRIFWGVKFKNRDLVDEENEKRRKKRKLKKVVKKKAVVNQEVCS